MKLSYEHCYVVGAFLGLFGCVSSGLLQVWLFCTGFLLSVLSLHVHFRLMRQSVERDHSALFTLAHVNAMRARDDAALASAERELYGQ